MDKNDFLFKDFIYLNMSFLESFTAQKYKGFPKEMQAESGFEISEQQKGEKITDNSQMNGKVGAGILGVEGTANITVEGMQFNQNNTEIVHNITLKVQKDNMYNKFYEYIQEKDLLVDAQNPTFEKYIEINDTFYYIDFDRIEKLCSEEYRPAYYAYNNGSSEFSYEKFNELRNKIVLLKKFIPFDALLCNNSYIILIDQTWLRTKKDFLGYLLGGKVNVVGKVSKALHTNAEMPDIIRILNRIQDYAISILNDFGLSMSEQAYIVSPIAIYH